MTGVDVAGAVQTGLAVAVALVALWGFLRTPQAGARHQGIPRQRGTHHHPHQTTRKDPK